jgi:NADPH-dependent 2,4-dienoyl-CoA reductase/sulfur reductase-like enzyme
MLRKLILFTFSNIFLFHSYAQQLTPVRTIEVDICVYGATSAGVIAAYTAKKLGKTVILIEPGKHPE